jgi:2-iminobutanoate/2-iminopropanoate deaminase
LPIVFEFAAGAPVRAHGRCDARIRCRPSCRGGQFENALPARTREANPATDWLRSGVRDPAQFDYAALSGRRRRFMIRKIARQDRAYLLRKTSPAGLWSSPRLSQVVEVQSARMIYLSGQTAADSNYRVLSADFRTQMHAVFDNIALALAAAGAGFEHIVKTTTYLTDIANRDAMREVRAQRLGHLAEAPANTALVVQSLIEPEFLVEIDVVAAVPLE